MPEFGSILLAEDDLKDVELICEALAVYNLVNRLVHVKDGAEALEYLRREGRYKAREPGNPAVLLMDIKMPRLDGIEVLRVLRSDPAFKMLPVVMLTSSREEQDLVRSYALGINAYVVKPLKFPEFVDAVKHIGIFWALLNEIPKVKNGNHG